MGHNLTLPRSPLLGRGDTLAQVQQLLLQEDVGLLTLTGPGGIGKTRLALQAAAHLLDHFVDGVYFVALASLVDPALVLPAIVQVLGVRETPAAAVPVRLREHLCDLELLLVLDNFEQLLPAPGSIRSDIAELLAACPRLKLLVTSRAPLHLYGEHEFLVPPLALPPVADLGKLASGTPDVDTTAALRRYAAVDLFCRRAAAVQPGFTLTPANALAVAQICTGLDGLPLAIELAAARLKLFGPAVLAARLQERLALLTNGPQDLPLRQRTLRDEIAWSYNLLRPEEQLLFRRLAVFAGGFTLDAAQAVGKLAYGPQSTIPSDVIDGLAALIDQSLVRQLDQAGADARLGMLETIREFALAQLEQSDEAELVRSRHAQYFLAFAETMAGKLDDEAVRKRAFAQLHADFENMRAAVAWCARPRLDASSHATDTTELALQLAGALSWFGLTGERLHDVYSLLETALQLPGGSPLARAKALWGAGMLAMFLGSHGQARTHLATSCELYRTAGDQTGLALALREACAAAYAERDLAAAQQYGEECIALLQAVGRLGDLALAYANLGDTLAARGNHAAARTAYEEGSAISLTHGYKALLGQAEAGLGWVASLQGDYAAAAVHLRKALALFRELEESWTTALALHLLGEIAQRTGDLPHAGRCLGESLLLAHRVGDKAAVGLILQDVGALACIQGCYADTARLFAAADAHHLAGAMLFYTLAGAEDRSQTLALARAGLGEESFSALWAQGHAMTLPRAVEFAAAVAERAVTTDAAAAQSYNLPSPPAVPLPANPDQLTVREREVLRLLAAGLSYAEIADKLVISPRTVNSHLTTIYSKLGVTSRAGAMHYALHHDL